MAVREPRIILFDLETLTNWQEAMKVFTQLGNYPGLTLKASINSIICFGYRVFGEDKSHVINAWDFKGWGKDVNDDKEIVKAAREILLGADAVVTHNGRRFDWKFLQTRILHHGLNFLPKIPHIDTCSLAKTNLYLFNNKLNTLAKFMTTEEKLENGGWDLWVKVAQRDKKSMKLMTEYCAQDVDVLYEIFKKLRPLCSNLPNHNLFIPTGEKEVCPNCGSTHLHRNGYRHTKTVSYRRIQCLDCGTWSRTDASDKFPRTA